MDPNLLKAFSEFCGFSEEDRQSLMQYLEPEQYAAGRRIVHAGSEAEDLLLVSEGQMCVEAFGSLERVAGPLSLGAYSLVRVGPSLVTVTAETPCCAWRLHRSGYRRLVDDEPRVACRLLEGVLAHSAGLGREVIEDFEGARKAGLPSLG